MGLRAAWAALWGQPQPVPRRRMYAGANTGRLAAGWVTSTTSADQEIKHSIKRLRARSRQLVRDSDWARGAVRLVRNQVIGQGVRLQAQVRKQRGGRLDDRVNRVIEEAWADWCRRDSCDVAGLLSFAGIEHMIATAIAESGEVFVRLVRQPFGRSVVPLGLQVFEADQCDEEFNGPLLAAGNEWRMGVEVDRYGRPQRYAFHSRHPGDSSFHVKRGADAKHLLLDAKDVVHLFSQDGLRPGQTRGVPMMASALNTLHHLQGFQEAHLVRKRAASALMGFIQSPEGELDPGGEIYENERVTSFSPGSFHYLSPGEQISVPDFDDDADFEPFVRQMLRSMASGFGVSFELLSSDYSQSNYSSSRLSRLSDKDTWQAFQTYLRETFYQPVFEEWLKLAVLSGAVSLPTYETEPQRFQRVRWVFRGYSYVDPQKEVQASADAVRAGFKTLSQCISEQGGDFEEVMRQRAQELELAEELGLNFDTSTPSMIEPAQAVNQPAETDKSSYQ